MFVEGEWLGEVGKEKIRGGWVQVYVAAFGAYSSVFYSVGEGQCEIHGSAVRMMGKRWKKVAIKRYDSREILVVYEAIWLKSGKVVVTIIYL
jgi:hypothetical protein